MFIPTTMFLLSSIVRPAFQEQPNHPVIDNRAILQTTEVSCLNWEPEESITILFPTFESLQTALSSPKCINEDVAKKVTNKLENIVGQRLYPSQLTRLLFELAFLDKTLTVEERTQNMGYLLSNLACGNSVLLEKLYAFYYAFSFEHFLPKDSK